LPPCWLLCSLVLPTRVSSQGQTTMPSTLWEVSSSLELTTPIHLWLCPFLIVKMVVVERGVPGESGHLAARPSAVPLVTEHALVTALVDVDMVVDPRMGPSI